MTQLQYDRTLTLVADEKAISELECSIFVDLDCNDEPFVSEIRVEPITGMGTLSLNDKCLTGGFRWHLWTALKDEAWEFVKGDVADDLMEAA